MRDLIRQGVADSEILIRELHNEISVCDLTIYS